MGKDRAGVEIVWGKDSGRRIKAKPGETHPFVAVVMEPIRESFGPDIALAAIRRFEFELKRFLGDKQVGNAVTFVQAHDGNGTIRIRIDRLIELIDYYTDLYEAEARIPSELRAATPHDQHRINWTGTQIQYRVLMNKLAVAGLIDKNSRDAYAAVFERHFLHKGGYVPASNIRSSNRKSNPVKDDKESPVIDAVRQAAESQGEK